MVLKYSETHYAISRFQSADLNGFSRQRI
jgi:hypothetical protein